MGRKYFGGLTFEEAVEMGRRAEAGDVEAQQRLYSGSDQMRASGDPILPMRHDLYNRANEWASQPGLWDTPYGGAMVAGLTPMQQQARSGLQGFLGGAGGMTNQAADIARGVGGYMPQNVTAGTVNPAQAAYAGNVSGGSFTSGDWGSYMNPFTSNVVDMAMGDIERARQIANQAGARSAGASTYGGDRNALIEAETNRGFADAAARTSAQLRSQGFDTAAGLMGQDLNRGLTAGLANQGMRQGLNQFNAGMMNDMGQFNAGLGLQAQGMNQQAGLQGQGLNLGAANTLGGFGTDLFNQGIAGASALNQFGTQEQMTNQLGLDANYNEWLRSRFGPMQGFNFLSGMQSGFPMQQPQGSPWSGIAGLGLTGAGLLMGGPAATAFMPGSWTGGT